MKVVGNLLDFSKKRNFLEAVLFFVTYFILTRILFSLLSEVFGEAVDKIIFSLQIGVVVFPFDLGVILVILVMLLLGILVLIKRNLMENPWYLLFLPLIFVVSFFWYTIGGLIVITFLTTRGSAVAQTSSETIGK